MSFSDVPALHEIAVGSSGPASQSVSLEGKAPDRSRPKEPARSGSIVLQRAQGASHVAFRFKDGRSRLHQLYQDGCAKVRLPTALPDLAPEAVLINTAGGLTGGDRLQTSIAVQSKASAVITTQACERIYRSTGDDAAVANRLNVENGARIAWLPQETILFDGGRLSRLLDVDLHGDAELIAVEAIVFGRTAMGERIRSGTLHDRWRVRRNGRLMFADDFRVSGEIESHLQRPAVLDGNLAMATVLFAGSEPERYLDAARGHIGSAGGASAWEGKLVVRMVAESSLMLRRRLEPLLQTFLGRQPLPKVWQT